MGKYPGLGLPLRYDYEMEYGQEQLQYPIGVDSNSPGATSDLLFVREVAMMDIMEKLTEKDNWTKKVFDDEIVAKWRDEALAIPDETLWRLAIADSSTDEVANDFQGDDQIEIAKKHPRWPDTNLSGIMSERSFDFCIQELRQKARYLEKSGIIPTLDAFASVAKSDTLVGPGLHEALRNAFRRLQADHASSPDWHPNSNDMVQDLVHPSMYPLVYGRSRVYQDEVVGVTEAIEKWAGKGSVIPAFENMGYHANIGAYGGTPKNCWSEKYQWLPANLAFQDDGSVKFTSYINNLHPNRYQDMYQALEKLVETSLPMWDQCLNIFIGYRKREGTGRTTSRFEAPIDPSDHNMENWTPTPKECAEFEVDMEEFQSECRFIDEKRKTKYFARYLENFKWKKFRKPAIPEPSPHGFDIDYTPQEGKHLIDRFRASGLQIIVKIASIELTPEKPEFPTGSWHVEGMMNEHICATSLYYLDSENVTPSSLSFRMQTDYDIRNLRRYHVGQDAYHWMDAVYGASFGSGSNGSPCLQNYGSVETRQGRLLAFPNVFQHHVSGFRLADPTKPGHRRFIALWLVDPNKRVVSTANVPPQQMSWWAESAFGASSDEQRDALSKLPAEVVSLLKEKGHAAGAIGADMKLPPELADIVQEHFIEDGGSLPMSIEEANAHRLALMEERSKFGKDAEHKRSKEKYNFCEH